MGWIVEKASEKSLRVPAINFLLIEVLQQPWSRAFQGMEKLEALLL